MRRTGVPFNVDKLGAILELSWSHHGGGAHIRRVDPLKISDKGTDKIRPVQIYFRASPESLW